MASPDEMLHELGGFEPVDAKKILTALEEAEIPFEVESDHSALGAPDRTFQLAFGMYPAGSRLLVFVPESALPKAQAIVRELFPV
jgi:hypothetical protein